MLSSAELNFSCVVVALLSCLSLASANSTRTASCTHYWQTESGPLLSGKVVGVDIGQSSYNDGYYDCMISLSVNDLKNENILYIGEVGDSAYVEFDNVNARNIEPIIVSHGLRPENKSEPRYLRFLPFTVPVERIFRGDGSYHFRLHYTHFFPLQAGLRSGPITLETPTGAVWRFLKDSPSLTFHIIQIVYFFFMILIFAFNTQLLPSTRIILSLASLTAGTAIFQLTAIPRYFLTPQTAYRANDFSQLIAFIFLILAIRELFEFRGKYFSLFFKIHVIFVITAILVLFQFRERGTTYLVLVGVSWLLAGGVTSAFLGIQVFRKSLNFKFAVKQPEWFGTTLLIIGAAYFFDIYNFVILKSRFYYTNHFIFFSSIIFSLGRLVSQISRRDVEFRRSLGELRTAALHEMVAARLEGGEILNDLSNGLSELVAAGRISILQIDQGMFRFLGLFGSYKARSGFLPVKSNSVLEKSIVSGEVTIGKAPGIQISADTTDYVVIPLKKDSGICGAICVTDFDHGNIPPFVKAKLELIQIECAVCVNLILMRHENLAQSNLLQIISQRTHSLQLRSEQYFLSHFDLPELSRDYSFIYGDLVGSVLLNEQYGGSRVGAMVDEHLELLWNKFQNLGIILGREKGDFISVTVPKLASDFGDTESGQRSAQIFRYLNSSEDIFQSIARKHGILLPVSYRFVFACAGKQSLISIQEKASMKAFTYLVDPAIDSAARLLNGFVLPRECIILSNAPEQFFEKNEIVELPAHRIRGKTQEVTIYKLKKNSSFKQSA